MRRAAYWLFPAIAIFVALFILVFMILMNPSSSVSSPNKSNGDENISLVLDEDAPGWLKHLKRNKEDGYTYPVNDLSLEIDSDTLDPKIKRFSLVVQLKDSYEFFCLKQELQNTTFSYLLNQEGESMSVKIDSNDLAGLEKLVTKLKTYQISATLSPYNED